MCFCVTVWAHNDYSNYWTKNCTSWRANLDSESSWGNLKDRYNTVKIWKQYLLPGHFYDLDMLEIGSMVWNEGEKNPLTEDEMLFSYTLRAFFMSPVQLSCHIDKLTDFEFDMICNEEIIGINQDGLFDYPELVSEDNQARVYKRKLENDDYAIAVFNGNDDEFKCNIQLDEDVIVRDVWRKTDMDCMNVIDVTLQPHSVRVFRCRKTL